MGNVHGLLLFGDRDGEVAVHLEVREGLLDVLAVRDCQGRLRHALWWHFWIAFEVFSSANSGLSSGVGW